MPKITKMAFEGLLYYGIAGSTAATLLENCLDVTIKDAKQTGDTTPRGDGTGPPVGSARVTRIDHGLDFNMLNKSDDTALEALRVAAAAGTPVALRGLDYAAGKGPDFDYILEVTGAQPANGAQAIQFSAEPTDESDRTPVLANIYV